MNENAGLGRKTIWGVARIIDPAMGRLSIVLTRLLISYSYQQEHEDWGE
jgi:hypothetical protein